jgi:hypothetical protein
MTYTIRQLFAPLALSAMAAVSFGASATDLTLLSVPGGTVGPQSTSAPCIIAATTCQNPATFDYTNYTQKGSLPLYNEVSPIYTVSQLPFLTFDVAIDVNTTNAAAEYLNAFTLTDLTTGVVLYSFDGAVHNGLIGDPANSNGNGYADWVLKTFDLSGLLATDQIQFSMSLSNATDGGESFFLVSTPAVPEPQSYALMTAGLAALGFIARRRRSEK